MNSENKKLIRNVVKHRYDFVLHFADGSTKEIKIMAESFSAAELLIPKALGVTGYECTLANETKE